MPRVCSVSGAPLAILSLIMKTRVVIKDDATLWAQSVTSSKADLRQVINGGLVVTPLKLW